jgi:hypothetical protein
LASSFAEFVKKPSQQPGFQSHRPRDSPLAAKFSLPIRKARSCIFFSFFLGEMTNAACCYQLVDCDEKISVIDPITLKKEKLPGNGILNAQDANA